MVDGIFYVLFRLQREREGRWAWKINEWNENRLRGKCLLSSLLLQSLSALDFVFRLWEKESNKIGNVRTT